MSSLNLHQRIVRIMETMGAIKKTGKTNYGEKFEYHKIDDVDDKLQDALVKHGVVATVTNIRDSKLESREGVDKYGNSRVEYSAQCLIEITLVNADNPSDTSMIIGWGQGLDYSDKAIGKAMSYAQKSAYLSAFHLRGQPDIEEDSSQSTSSDVVVTEKMQGWIDGFNQCDSIETFNAMKAKLASEEPISFADSINGWVKNAEAVCWVCEIRRAGDKTELAAIGHAIAKCIPDVRTAVKEEYVRKAKSLSS